MTYKISRELMGSRALNLGRTTAGLCFQELLHLLSGRAHSAAGDAQPLGRFWATGYRVAFKETASAQIEPRLPKGAWRRSRRGP